MRIKVKQWKIDNGITSEEEFQAALEEAVLDSVCPAMCSEGCEVEPDGTCEHGCPSLLLALGMI
jgi:hypothetical protein